MLFLQLYIQFHKVLLPIALVWLHCFNTLTLKALNLISKICPFSVCLDFPFPQLQTLSSVSYLLPN